MRYLVTGGAGFLGSSLIRTLLARGEKVVCVDNLLSGKIENLAEFWENKNFSFLLRDIIEPIDVECEFIFNLACPASPPIYQRNPLHTLDTCYLGAKNLLTLAKKNHARILQASTSEIYGDAEIVPQPETYFGNVDTCGIRSCYDEGKRIVESLFCDHHRMYGTDFRIARIFNSYGPGMSREDGRVVSNFCFQALKGEPITIYGDGFQTRSFCFRDDTINGLVALMQAELIFTPVNIGNPNEMTVLQLAETIKELCKSNSKIVFKPLPSGDPKRRKPDIQKAKQLLNWEPKVNLTDGLLQTITWAKDVLEKQGKLR